MTDKERLLGLLEHTELGSINAIMKYFLNIYGSDISFSVMRDLAKTVNTHLEYKLDNLERAVFVANERAGYIKKYLEGKMWPDEETAKFYLQPQIDNAQAIIDACAGR